MVTYRSASGQHEPPQLTPRHDDPTNPLNKKSTTQPTHTTQWRRPNIEFVRRRPLLGASEGRRPSWPDTADTGTGCVCVVSHVVVRDCLTFAHVSNKPNIDEHEMIMLSATHKRRNTRYRPPPSTTWHDDPSPHFPFSSSSLTPLAVGVASLAGASSVSATNSPILDP